MTLCGALLPIRVSAARAGNLAHEREIDLLLETVDFVDLNGEVITELDDAAGATTGEMIPRRVEDEEVILDAGEWHETAHAKAGHIHEETKVSNIGDESGVGLRFFGGELGFQVSVEFDLFAITLGIAGVPLGGGDVIGDLLGITGLHVHFVKKSAVHHEVGVTTDRGGEMRVLGFGEAVVTQRLDSVAGPHE